MAPCELPIVAVERIAAVDYFLRDERAAMRTFMQDLTRGAFTLVDHLLWRWPSG